MLALLIALVIPLFGTAAVNLTKIMLINGEFYKEKAAGQQLRDVTLPATRGDIVDRNGNILATSATVHTLFIAPKTVKVSDDDENGTKTEARRNLISDGLASILNLDRGKIYAATKKNTSYEIIKRKVEKPEADKVREFISENKLGSIIGLDEASKRYYPNDTLASTIMGFVGDDNQGLEGLEKYYDNDLKGQDGRVMALQNAVGATMPFSYETTVNPVSGNTLMLTIDEYIQHYVDKHLEQAVKDNSVTNRGACIVMDPQNGEILAMSVKPDYNLNAPFEIYDETAKAKIASLSGDERTKEIAQEQQQQWRNKIISDLYEPGSTFKLLTGAMGLDQGVVNVNSSFNCTSAFSVSDRTYHCANNKAHGSLTFIEAFEKSCNISFIQIGQRVGNIAFQQYFKSLGLNDRTGIDLIGETSNKGLNYSEKKMGPVELASNSFGQTSSITPIQMITAASAVANGGYLVTPHLMKQEMDANNNIVKTAAEPRKRQVVSSQTSQTMLAAMEGVVKNGTAKNANVTGYRVGGKTGTSEKVQQNAQNPDKPKEYIASFVAFAPIDNPKVAVLMLLDQPHGENIHGGTIVAPVVGALLADILPHLGIEPKYTEEQLATLDVQTPNVTAIAVTQAKNKLESAGLKVKTVGNGNTVLKQNPAANTSIPKNGTVVLYTSESKQSDPVTVPDLTNLSISAAGREAIEAGVNVKIAGYATGDSGAVSFKQSIAKNTKVEAGTVITVEFRVIDRGDSTTG
jgi:stage V sporulation protein D (sporulation-specific penicillin-binding protein)